MGAGFADAAGSVSAEVGRSAATRSTGDESARIDRRGALLTRLGFASETGSAWSSGGAGARAGPGAEVRTGDGEGAGANAGTRTFGFGGSAAGSRCSAVGSPDGAAAAAARAASARRAPRREPRVRACD